MRETMPRDWWVGPLYIALAFPLGVLAWLLETVAEILQSFAHVADTVQRKWLYTTRRWTGRIPRVVAERESFSTPEERHDA